jgi:hypothetical protein
MSQVPVSAVHMALCMAVLQPRAQLLRIQLVNTPL